MKVTLWGTRGSIAAPGPDTVRHGGNTSCVSVEEGDTLLVLDAGTGIRRLGNSLDRPRRIDVLLTHLHLDHIQGLGFFRPLFEPGFEIHVWGPPSTTSNLRRRLTRYLSPPLFPVRLRDVASSVHLHDAPAGEFAIGPFRIEGALVCHPGPTLGWRVANGGGTMAYLPDHEPALGCRKFPIAPEWTSGYGLARGADLLLHDGQYTDDEYPAHAGWGHSSLGHAVAFATLAGARRLVTLHHDPAHSDSDLEHSLAYGRKKAPAGLEIDAGYEGAEYLL